MTLIEEFFKGVAFGIGFAIVSVISEYIKLSLRKPRKRNKKGQVLKLVKNK